MYHFMFDPAWEDGALAALLARMNCRQGAWNTCARPGRHLRDGLSRPAGQVGEVPQRTMTEHLDHFNKALCSVRRPLGTLRRIPRLALLLKKPRAPRLGSGHSTDLSPVL